MKLLLLLEISVKLRNSLQREFLIQPNKHRVLQVLVSEFFDFLGVSGAIKRYLLICWHDLDDRLHDVLEVS